MQTARKNLRVSMLIWIASIGSAATLRAYVSQEVLHSILLNIWIVQAVLVTAVVTLIYRLQSDLAAVANLDSLQRAMLDEFVSKKTLRLWVLFFMFAVSALLPRVMDVAPPRAVPSLTSISIVLAIATALYCLYIPSMWNELRRFLAEAASRNEALERQRRELERLRSNSIAT